MCIWRGDQSDVVRFEAFGAITDGGSRRQITDPKLGQRI